MTVAWIIIAAVGAVALAVGLVRFVRAILPDRRDEELPLTPLERLGWVGLAVTSATGIGLALLVGINGVTGFNQKAWARGIFTVLLLAGIAAWFLTWRIVSRPAGRAVIDERDRSIQARSFTVESVMVILSLVAWTVTLTEIYWDDGVVPLGYLQLIFWSTFIVGAFGRSLGIVLGYRREPLVDA